MAASESKVLTQLCAWLDGALRWYKPPVLSRCHCHGTTAICQVDVK